MQANLVPFLFLEIRPTARERAQQTLFASPALPIRRDHRAIPDANPISHTGFLDRAVTNAAALFFAHRHT